MTDDRTGPLWIDMAASSPTAEEKERLSHPLVGGVVLFARNYESPEQLRHLCDTLHALKDPPLLLVADQEGGRVQRFIAGMTRLPAAAALGACYDANPGQALTLANDLGWLLAAELSAVGVDMALAPVVDLAGSDLTGVIGDRAWHGDPGAVAALAGACLDGMRAAGMAGMAKHFPGHGAVAGDTHTGTCRDHRSLAQIRDRDLRPYVSLFSSGLPAVMTCHVTYPHVDPEPASYSDMWLRRILRQGMGFSGLVVSDDLGMEAAAVAGDGVGRVRASLGAGCDVAIVCNAPAAVDQVLDRPGNIGLFPAAAMTPLRYRTARPALADVRADARWRRAVERLCGEPGSGGGTGIAGPA